MVSKPIYCFKIFDVIKGIFACPALCLLNTEMQTVLFRFKHCFGASYCLHNSSCVCCWPCLCVLAGYLQLFCQVLLDELDKVPGDTRTQIAFLAYDRFLYFFGLAEGQSQPQMMVVPDLEGRSWKITSSQIVENMKILIKRMHWAKDANLVFL